MRDIIALPVVFDGESNEDYHTRKEFISASRLKMMGKSPFHYSQYFLDPDSGKATAAQSLGTLVHTLLLEPALFDKENLVVKEGVNIKRNTKEGKENYNNMLLEAKGRNIVSHDDYITAIAMKQAALNCEAVIKLLDSGMPEQSIYYIDEATGLKAKVRCDFRRSNGNLWNTIIDLKTTDDASQDAFGKTIVKYDYLTQAGMQVEGVRQVLGFTIKYYLYIAIENKFPYGVAVYRLTDDDLFIGITQYKHFMQKVKECTETGVWGSYDTLADASYGIHTAKLPAWRKNLLI